MNNLKQVGLAMHEYRDATRGLTPARLIGKGAKGNDLVLPYLEQSGLHS